MAKRRLFGSLFSAAVLIFALTAVMVYLWGELFIAEFQSDVTDTLLWARETAESGRLVNPDFFYPYAIPFGGNLLLLPFYKLFGLSVTAMRAGMTVFTLLLTFALLLFFDKAVFRSHAPAALSSGVVLLIFLTNTKLREIMYGHIIHYSLAVLFTALLVSFTAIMLQKERKRPVVYVLLLLTMFFCAAQGLPIIALAAVPVIGAFILERLIHVWLLKKPYPELKHELRLFVPALLALALGFGAYKLSLGNVYTPYGEHFSNLVPPVLWADNLKEMGRQWALMLLRPELYGDTALLAQELSPAGAALDGIQKLFMIAVPVLVGVLSLCRYQRLETRIERILVLSFWCLAGIMLFLYVVTPLNGGCWRMVPLLFLLLVCCCVLVRNLLMSDSKALRLSAAALAGALALFALNAGVGVMAAKTEGSVWFEEGSVIEVLRRNGLKRGYSNDFMLCPAPEVLSNDELQIKYSSVQDGRLYPLLYQNRISEYEFSDEDGAYFLIMVDGSSANAPAGGRSIYKGTAFIPSYSRMSDGMHEYEILVYDSDPREPYYLVHHSELILDADGRECLPEDINTK